MLNRRQALTRHKNTIENVQNILRESSKPGLKMSTRQKENIAMMLETFQAGVRRKSNGGSFANGDNLLESVESFVANDKKALVEGRGARTLGRRRLEGSNRGAEGTGLSDIGPFTKFGINLITAVMSNVVAEQLVSVQPMNHRIGEARYLKYVYADNKGISGKGDLISSALEYAGEDMSYSSDHIEGEVFNTTSGTLAWLPLQAGSVEFVKADGTLLAKDDGKGKLVDATGSAISGGTVDYTTGAVAGVPANSGTVKYAYITTNVNPAVPSIEAQIEIMPIKAISRKLKTAYSFDAAFDLQGDYGFDIDAETVTYFSNEIAHEIDGEIMQDLKSMSLANVVANAQDRIPEWDAKAPTGVSQADHDDSFWNNIVTGGNQIFKRVKRGRASFVIAGVDVCNTIETMRTFNATGDSNATGPHIIGTVKNTLIIKNPYYNDKEYVVGYKGSNDIDAGYIYSPYIPVTVINTVKPDNFTFSKGFATAYGKTALNHKLYCYGTVK